MEPTIQQLDIIQAIASGKNVAIQAGAGSAKTTTCLMAGREIKKPSTYIAFNATIAAEARSKFPKLYFDCRTINSIAWERLVKGTKFQKKLSVLDRREIGNFIQTFSNVNSEILGLVTTQVMDLITKFCNSSAPDLDTYFICNNIEQGLVTKIANALWEKLIDKNDPIKISHDIYLKLFQLGRQVIDTDIIYWDEFQDTNPVCLDIFMQQNCQKVVVGDPFQAIYGWRGAINAFDWLDNSFETRYLTQSFRFNQEIADIGNSIIRQLGSEQEIVGTSQRKIVETKASIVRTNLDLFAFLYNNYLHGLDTYVNGDLKELFTDLYSASNLRSNGDPTRRFSKKIQGYKNWKEFVDEAEHVMENRKIINILNNFPNIYEVIQNINSIVVKDITVAKDIVSTAHKAKGLEWDEVTLGDGFFPESFYEDMTEEEQWEYINDGQVGNLLYVCVTRAKVKVNINKEVRWFLGNGEEV